MEAEEQYKTGLEQKKQGQFDAALTSFRRAVIADPSHAAAHMEIGLLCRDKAKTDAMFLRYAFEAFQKAARLAPSNEQAHLYYVTVGQKTGALDTLLDEYATLVKKNPENELFKNTHKNVIALTMAMMPQQVNVSDGSPANLRKFTLLVCIMLFLTGIGFIIAPPILLKQGKIEKSQVGGLVRIGLLIEAMSIVGFVLRAKFH